MRERTQAHTVECRLGNEAAAQATAFGTRPQVVLFNQIKVKGLTHSVSWKCRVGIYDVRH